uniref:B30.2/SPRY domain-containing protein n=1 Tax=Globodera rostochiensis TaxID=31243 RepID=A0A914HBA5_GLORO
MRKTAAFDRLFSGRAERGWNSDDTRADAVKARPPEDGVRGYVYVKCSVFGERPICTKKHCGIFYYEVNIVKKSAGVCIGLATKQMPLSNCVGDDDGTYAYAKRGVFWGFADAPRYPCCSGRYIYEGVPSFTVGDVVGCGVNLATRQLIYTKNGERLDTSNLFVVSVDNGYRTFGTLDIWHTDIWHIGHLAH